MLYVTFSAFVIILMRASRLAYVHGLTNKLEEAVSSISFEDSPIF